MPQRLRVFVPQDVEDVIRKLHPVPRRKVRAAIEHLQVEPHSGNELSRELAGMRRIRVGRLRVVYMIEQERVTVIRVGPRETIYQELGSGGR